MINGLAIWHYPHRNDLQNAGFFADNGFGAVSMHGKAMTKVCMDEERSVAFADLIREKNLVLTAHGKLPSTHGEEDVAEFRRSIDAMAKWQAKYGLLAILSFDVPQEIRDNILPYLEYVLAYGQFGKIAVEDFGLTKAERAQIEPLKENGRFGYLLDIGHMNIRLRGRGAEQYTLFANSPEECPKTENPGYEEFLQAFRSKEFPIFEIHLHNNDGATDGHGFLEQGTLDMKNIADVLKTIGYEGVVTIESVPRMQGCFPPESDARILQTFDYWKNLIK